MNKIVRENYLASKLPEDLREGLDPGAIVRVVIKPREARAEPPKNLSELKKMIDELKSRPDFEPEAADQAVRRIRDPRDEWDS